MYQRTFKENHIENSSCEKVDKICSPLKQVLNINYFSYQRYYTNWKMFVLQNRNDWAKYFYDNQLYLEFDVLPNIIKNKIIFSDDLPTDSNTYKKIIKPANDLFDMHYMIAIPIFNLNYFELVILGFPKEEKNVERKVILHLDYIKKFILYFKEKAASLIEIASQTRFPVSGNFKENAKKNVHEEHLSFNPNILDIIDVKRYYLLGTEEDVYFTRREMDCIYLLVEDQKYVHIAEMLNLSTKTIYEYIENIKFKLACDSKVKFNKKLQQLAMLNNLEKDFTLTLKDKYFKEFYQNL